MGGYIGSLLKGYGSVSNHSLLKPTDPADHVFWNRLLSSACRILVLTWSLRPLSRCWLKE